MRTAVKFAYNGKIFYGYARQPQLRTVEGEIIKSLIKYGFIEDTKESDFRSSSRTDKNVSALCNVIAFNTNASKKQIIKKLSDEFDDIIFYATADVESDFNPRYTKYRHYRYFIKNSDLEVEKIISTAACFTGTHNFSNFARIEEFKDPVRTIDNIILTKDEDCIIIDFYAQTFLWYQIRRIISALIRVGKNKLSKQEVVEALANPEKKVDYGLAPAEPLILNDIIYNLDFEIDNNQLKKLEKLENEIITSIRN